MQSWYFLAKTYNFEKRLIKLAPLLFVIYACKASVIKYLKMQYRRIDIIYESLIY